MSYASGLALGASLGKMIHDFLVSGAKKSPKNFAKNEGLALVSALPGRHRYRAFGLDGNLAKLLPEKFTRLEFIESCSVNPLTGSILLVFSPADLDKVNKLMRDFSRRFFGGNDAASPDAAPNQASDIPRAGKLTQSVRAQARQISDWLKVHTGGWFDISSLASVFFLFRGLRKMLLTQQMPSGSQMLWWALSLMRGWRTA